MAPQVKGQIARIARCLQDPEPRIAGLAHLFFEELSHKVTKVCPSVRLGCERTLERLPYASRLSYCGRLCPEASTETVRTPQQHQFHCS